MQISNKIKYGNEKSFWKNIVEITFQPFANKENIEPLFESLWEAFATGKTWKLADHAIETISALQKKGIQAAILSNNDSRLRLVLQDLKIEDYFEHIFISSELGFEKPDIEIFRNVETTFALLASSTDAAQQMQNSVSHDILVGVMAAVILVLSLLIIVVVALFFRRRKVILLQKQD